MRFTLKAKGYQITLVGDAEAALELLLSQPKWLNLVVLDARLPGKDSFEVVAELRDAGPCGRLCATGRNSLRP